MILAFLTGCISHSGPDNPWDSPWSFEIESASVPATQSNGDQWDSDGSPPDPLTIVSVNNVVLDRTPSDDQTYSPDWRYMTKSTMIKQDDVISFEIQDSDDFSNDIIMDCSATATALADMPGVTLQCGLLNFAVNF
jgi:hypothetical protein